MKPVNEPNAHYLDLIFKNRNKAYGGYQLRMDYGSRLKKAVLITYSTLAVVMLLLSFRPAPKVPAIVADRPGVIKVHEVDLSSKPKMPQPPAAPKDATPKTNLHTEPKIVSGTVPEEKQMHHNQEVGQGEIGKGGGTDSAGVTGGVPGGGSGGDVLPKPEVKTELPRTIAEQMPQFDGDMMAYLANAVKYPDEARNAGIEGRVLVRFVIAEDGSVQEPVVVRGIGGGCDQEALRVVQAMPKWHAGKQNGRPVKVFFTIPIKFVLE